MKPTYQPGEIERRWYPVWEDSGAFQPELNPDGEAFTIVIPPPNVTGVLHMGHALDGTVQDVLIRRKRMQGYRALWLPGMDHAGIATQNVVERQLAEEGLTRHDLGRDRFVEQVWDWKARSGGKITEQMRAMGFSCDWSRERFTLDEGLSNAVREVFVSLYEQDIIYRGSRITNWCPFCQTALSDIEVDHIEEVGTLTNIRYPFTDGDGYVEVATTRPETMLGDTGVAVHPADLRYQSAVGRTVTLPLLGREIPVVADEAVDPTFGTGAVKLTPAHDPLDFEIGKRADLDQIVVIDTTGHITAVGGPFAGMERFAAREAVVAALDEMGVLGARKEHLHSVGHCSRSKTVVEPVLSTQWFVRVEPMVGPAMEVVSAGRSKFVPPRWENNYLRWMENLNDWCVSRQLWWGHRIPAWYCDGCATTIVARQEPLTCGECGGALRAEEDVLDTWFSSALWPFSTLGWPEQTEDFRTHYPTSVLVTGYDIIFFWVARMLKMGIHFTDSPPFKDIAVHGLVRAEDGRKMSKSLNNSVNPLDLVASHGADPLRLALLQAAAQGQDVPYSEDMVDAARRFGNKLWNALRFAVDHIGISDVASDGGYPETPSPIDQWVLARLGAVQEEYDTLLEGYRLSEAAALIYNFAWSEVFDWYLEMAKVPLRDESRAAATKQTVAVVLRDLLKLLHPLVPFITEELWYELVGQGLLVAAKWPDVPVYEVPGEVVELQNFVVDVRRFRAEHNLGARKLTAQIDNFAGDDWVGEQIASLARIDVTDAVSLAERTTRVGSGSIVARIRLEDVVDAAAECPRIERAIAETERLLGQTQSKLANTNFVDRAPPEVVSKERAKREEFASRLAKLHKQYAQLCG